MNPWYDEAQAWQIAKCASIREIVFKVPHFEGHPPLWHLLLAPFAKLGMPYEFSLSFVNILFIAAAVWVLMFKTKLPAVMKLTLPFTYFLFYQYAVISRPYSVMTLAFILCAVYYNDKNEKPLRMVLSLMLLCASSAYGIVYAFFICIAWLIELWNGRSFIVFVKEFVKSRSFICLFVLAIFALCLFLLIIPSEKSLVSASMKTNSVKSYINNFLYTFLLLPFDATIGNIITEDTDIFEENFIRLSYIPYFIISAAIYVMLLLTAKKHKKIRLFLPVVIMPLIFGSIFFFSHHIGMFTLYIIFFICVCFDGDESLTSEKELCAESLVFVSFIYLTIIIQIFWSAFSGILEISKNYYCSRDVAEFIIENDISDLYIMPAGFATDKEYDFNTSAYAVTTLPYFDENIYPTFNHGNNSEGYVLNYAYTNEELRQNIDEIKELGTPDYIIGTLDTSSKKNVDWDDIEDEKSSVPDDYFDFVYDNANYIIAADIKSGMIFKGHYIDNYAVIFKKETIQ